MNPEIRAKAEALADALANSEVYQAVKAAREELERHEAARIMYRDFRQKQAALEAKVLAGENPSDEEVQALQQAMQIVALNPYVRKLLEAEAAFAVTFAEVQRILAGAVGIELPQAPAPGPAAGSAGAGASGAAGAAAEGSRSSGGRDDEGGAARSRLWVPGR
ncbi:MAG: YlbF family regulator [Clostridia bacterium]